MGGGGFLFDSVDLSLALMIDETNENISVGNVRGQMATCLFDHPVYQFTFAIDHLHNYCLG